MSQPDIQEQADFYDKRWTSASKRREFQHLKNRIAAIRRILEALQLQQPEILEIGSGLGRIAGELLKFGKVEGIELSPKAVEIAKEKYPEGHFFSGDLFSYDFGERRFDVVVTSEVVEHISLDKREKFARILWERCKPDGYLILTTPNKLISDKLTVDQPIENHFIEEELRNLLQPYFEITTFTTTQTFFPVLCSKHRLFQVLRLFVYEVLRLREVIENPFKGKENGLYFVVVGRSRNSVR